MAIDYTTIPFTHVRRQDRAVQDEAWIAELLARAPMGTLALTVAGQPLVNMNLFVYAPEVHAIYLHTARTGRTPTTIGAGAAACFSVSEMGRLLPAPTAKEFSVEYSGVVAFGTIVPVTDEAEAAHALQILLDKYAPHLRPGRDYRASTPEELALTAVFRMKIVEWTGKRKVAPEDFPGAFWYNQGHVG